MLSVAEQHIKNLNSAAKPNLYGQDWNDEAWAVCKSDMLIKGRDAENVILGDTFTKDGFDRNQSGEKWTFDYMLANPPFGVEWKQQQRAIEKEKDTLGYDGRFGAGTPRVNDGALLFLQHMISKMRPPKEGGSRLAIVFNGSPLFTGDAGSGESNIRRWIIENDWLEAIVAMPEQLFYNTGISTYIWVITNRKEKERKGKVQLIDARNFWVPMRKSLGNKRRKIGDKDEGEQGHIQDVTEIYGNFKNNETRTITVDGQEKKLVVSKIFDNEDFGYRKIIVERPIKLNFQVTDERLSRLDSQSGFASLLTSTKKDEKARLKEKEEGKKRQDQIKSMLKEFSKKHGVRIFKDRKEFLNELKEIDKTLNVRLDASELKAIVSALCERDETAENCTDKSGNPESDADLRDSEMVPLKEAIEDYFKREVLPHVPDAWIDHDKEKIGYDIPLNRHFYKYEPPKPLDVIEKELQGLEGEIMSLLKGVSA